VKGGKVAEHYEHQTVFLFVSTAVRL
jgi:hypothetical protein